MSLCPPSQSCEDWFYAFFFFLGQERTLLVCQAPSILGSRENGCRAAGFQSEGELLERALQLCSQTPADDTKGWLQAHNGGVVSHSARAAGRETEPLCLRLLGRALQPQCPCLWLLFAAPTPLPTLTPCCPPPTWQPGWCILAKALVSLSHPGQRYAAS